jgi:hypothetical protein
MKKILSLVAISFLVATSVFAWVATEYGSTNVEACYVVNEADLVSGDVVILQTTSPTHWGREVTTTTTEGLPIYGVVLGDPTATKCDSGTWIRVQTHGYCPTVKLATYTAVTVNTSYLVTSSEYGRAVAVPDINGVATETTGNSVALESRKAQSSNSGDFEADGTTFSGSTIRALLNW